MLFLQQHFLFILMENAGKQTPRCFSWSGIQDNIELEFRFFSTTITNPEKINCPVNSWNLINSLNRVRDFLNSHSTSSATFPQGRVDLLITGSEVHYRCVHCQPSWLGLQEGHTDLIRRSWVLITSPAERLWLHLCRLAQVLLTKAALWQQTGLTKADFMFWGFIWGKMNYMTIANIKGK